MGTEIELKFDVEPQAARQLASIPALAGKPRRTRMRSIYFDTPEALLARNGMALRLRREGRRWVQALKAGKSGTGGVHSRGEWEFDRRGATLDVTLLEGTPFTKLEDPAAVASRLAPVFEVHFVRDAWTVEPAPGTKLELAFDKGSVEAKKRTAPVCEVEIECLEGTPSHAFELAREVMERVALRPSAVSKAERGYRLLANDRPRPVKAAKVPLDASMTPADAARAIVAAGLEQLQANDAGLAAHSDPEYVHQARVAMRRMRSALRMFRREIGIDRAKRWRDALGDTSRALGRSRDWDVFAMHTLPGALAEYGDEGLARRLKGRVGRRRGRERQAAREALRSPAHARALLEISQWIAHADGAADPQARATLPDFAAQVIRKRRKRLFTRALLLGSLGAAEQHRVRIDTKRLRYALDGLGSLFRHKALEPFAKTVEDLQDALGECNDAATAMTLVGELAATPEFEAFARGWFAGRARGEPQLLEPLVAELTRKRREWLKNV
ncbi:MAG TPA: CHAD domain-containing protein [Usitatibacter sp.]|nr:CHAD domain-containing protein [Usitatibacter sp.]